jgi:hypothetical protein
MHRFPFYDNGSPLNARLGRDTEFHELTHRVRMASKRYLALKIFADIRE